MIIPNSVPSNIRPMVPTYILPTTAVCNGLASNSTSSLQEDPEYVPADGWPLITIPHTDGPGLLSKTPRRPYCEFYFAAIILLFIINLIEYGFRADHDGPSHAYLIIIYYYPLNISSFLHSEKSTRCVFHPRPLLRNEF